MRLILLVLSIVVTVSAQFPNSGFENWTGPNPDSCWVNNSVVAPVLKSALSFKGSYALRGEVVPYVGVPYGPQVTIGGIQGFAYTGRPGSVQFYYQFFPQGGDKFEASITLRKMNPLKIIAACAPVKITSTVSTYSLITVPLEYFYPETPDVCVATFIISNPSTEHVGSYFNLDEIAFAGTATSIHNTDVHIPAAFDLYQNYPNPFNPNTVIRYSLPSTANVKLAVYDLLGREITILVNERQTSGLKEVQWDASLFSSGVYLYKLQTEQYVGVRKLMLMK